MANKKNKGGRPGMRGGRGARNAKGTMARMLKLLWKGNQIKLIIVVICIAISAYAGAAGSVFLKTLVDDYVEPMLASGASDYSGLAMALLRMACIYVMGILSTFAYNRIMIIVAQGTLLGIRQRMFSHMQTLPIRYFDTHTHGDIMSKYTNDTDTMRQLISQSIPQLVNTIMTVIVVFYNMIRLSPVLTVVVVVFLIIKFTFVGNIGGKSGYYFVRQQQSLGRINGFAEEMINGEKVVKVFNHEEKARARFDELNEELCENSSKANAYANVLMPIMANIGYLLYVTVAIVGGAIAIHASQVEAMSALGQFFFGGLTLGTIVAFLTLTRNFNMPINQAAQQVNAVVMALAGAERVFELIDEAPEDDRGTVTLVNVTVDENGQCTESDRPTRSWAWKVPQPDGGTKLVPVTGDVRFNSVDFAYVEGTTILHDISLYAKPGQKLAFIGATGAGKTTITNLINRFYDIEDGKVTYDGISINDIRKDDLRHSLGIVLQDVNLFTGTVMDNIRYGRLDATDEECIAAAKLANAHSFISRLPQGYQTQLSGDGSDLSQGQCQLLSIARAAVADPPVMILDEATSSIDTRTEAIVQKGMDRLMEGRTVFVIAHRLSTVMNSNAIIVLDHGRIIERGTHEQLIAQKGTYYQLYTGAFELE